MHNKDIYPYIVIGDGEVGSAQIAAHMLRSSLLRLPIPNFQYAKTIDRARIISERMKAWNGTVLICKVEEVVQ